MTRNIAKRREREYPHRMNCTQCGRTFTPGEEIYAGEAQIVKDLRVQERKEDVQFCSDGDCADMYCFKSQEVLSLKLAQAP